MRVVRARMMRRVAHAASARAALTAVLAAQVVKRMAATGRLELPPDLQASLDALEQGLLGSERSCGSVASSVYSARLSSGGSRAAAAAAAAAQLHRAQQEAALQQALEEEILAEISREAALQVRACF